MPKKVAYRCQKCNTLSRQYSKIYGKALCPKCSYEFYRNIRKIIQKDPAVEKEFKRWFFEMEIEE